MATLLQQRPRPALPGGEVKHFPARNPSYRALSIIDAYSADIHPPPQLGEQKEEEKTAPAEVNGVQGLRSRKESIKESYASNFDIDEAYGSGEADVYEDDIDDIVNLGEYDPYRSISPPPRISSRKPTFDLKVETKVEMIEVKPEPPPKPRDGDYDPFKAVSPPRRNPALLGVRELASRSEPLLAVFNKGAMSPAVPPKDGPKLPVSGSMLSATKSTSQLSALSTPRSVNMDKALPTVPGVPRKLLATPLERKALKEEKALPTPAGQQQRAKILPGLPKRPDGEVQGKEDTRKDSLIQSDKESLSVTSSPRTKRSPTEAEWMTPKSSLEQEDAIRVPTGIKRTSKPASLSLTKSNGSTAASGDKATIEVQKPVFAQLLAMKLSPVSQVLGGTDKSAPPSPSRIVSPHVAPDSATATAVRHNNPIGAAFRLSISEPRPDSTDTASLADDESAAAKINLDMQRIKNLVKRKPVGGSTSSTSSSTFSKENSNPHRATSSSKAATGAPSHPANAYPPHSHPYQRHARRESYTSNAATISPVFNQSLEAFPTLENQTSSATTILSPRPEISRPTTPPVLRSPTPLLQLEESPSKCGLKKKSEGNLRMVTEERQSQIFGRGSNGVLRFLTAQKALQDSLTEDAPRSPIYDANTVVQNEAKRTNFYHASLLDYVKERPSDSNAPQLSTTQLHCHNDHIPQWFTNSNTVHPINCSICDMEGGPRWFCSSCGLRVCQECCEAIKARVENTEFGKILKEAKEETERRRAEFATRRARSNTERTVTPSRPGSPVVYPPSDSDTLYANHGAATSTRSLPGNMHPHSRQREQRRQMYPPSAFNRTPYGRPPGHRSHASISSLPTRDAPPTPRIPDQYWSDRNSKISIPRSSRGSDMEMRGRAGPSPERSRHHSASRHGSPIRGLPAEGRARSRPRPSRNMEVDPMVELRRAPAGPYAAVPRGAGARTPGSTR